MKVAIGSDHAGLKLKSYLIEKLKEVNIDVEDYGTVSEDSVDYPDYAKLVAKAVAGGQAKRGILVCGTGIGMCITANKVKGIRAALVYDENTARLSRSHNNSNILCLGGRTTEPKKARKLVKIWLETPFEGERHQDRLNKIASLEQNCKNE